MTINLTSAGEKKAISGRWHSKSKCSEAGKQAVFRKERLVPFYRDNMRIEDSQVGIRLE